MERRRKAVVKRDLKLLKTYSMRDGKALEELTELYMNTPIEKREAQMKEISRYFRALACQLNRHVQEAGGIN